MCMRVRPKLQWSSKPIYTMSLVKFNLIYASESWRIRHFECTHKQIKKKNVIYHTHIALNLYIETA